MGLFGSKTQTPSISLEEALLLNDANELTTAGLKGLDVDWAIMAGHPVCKYQQKGWWFSDLKISSIQSFRNDMISVFKIFEMAEQQGSAIASFVLGVMYEHGIGLDALDFDSAEKHYELAEYRGCKLVKIVRILRSVHKIPIELQSSQQENVALGMLAVCRHDDVFGEQVRQNSSIDLTEEEQRVLLQLATYLMYYYAEKEYPVSLCFAQINSELYKSFLKEGKTHKYNMVKGSSAASDLNKRLKNLVVMGDQKAIATCQRLNITFYD